MVEKISVTLTIYRSSLTREGKEKEKGKRKEVLRGEIVLLFVFSFFQLNVVHGGGGRKAKEGGGKKRNRG